MASHTRTLGQRGKGRGRERGGEGREMEGEGRWKGRGREEPQINFLSCYSLIISREIVNK